MGFIIIVLLPFMPSGFALARVCGPASRRTKPWPPRIALAMPIANGAHNQRASPRGWCQIPGVMTFLATLASLRPRVCRRLTAGPLILLFVVEATVAL
jgi:hypothetical protein